MYKSTPYYEIDKGIILHWLIDFLSRTSTETIFDDIDTEIEEMKGAISNERMWEMGSSSIEQSAMHNNNINTMLKYIDILEKVKNDLQSKSNKNSEEVK